MKMSGAALPELLLMPLTAAASTTPARIVPTRVRSAKMSKTRTVISILFVMCMAILAASLPVLSACSTTDSQDYLSTSRFIDEVHEISFYEPKDWVSESKTDEPDTYLWQASPEETLLVGIYFDAFERTPAQSAEEITSDYFAGLTAVTLSECESEVVDRVSLNGTDYWKIEGKGTWGPVGQETFPAQVTFFIHYGDGFTYSFKYMNLNEDECDTDYYKYFEALMSSVIYE